MTQAQKVEQLALMCDDNNTNSGVLTIYLNIAKQAVLNKAFPYGVPSDVIDVPEKYESIQLNIACYLYNKRGAEGELSHKENGIDRTYESADIPSSMLKQVIPFVGVL